MRFWVSSMLYLIEILHQTTTPLRYEERYERCILSKFYIKPQPFARVRELLKVVSYRNSTSNHNVWLSKATHKRLYLIEILHQTTTTAAGAIGNIGCILSKFYIKPQQHSDAWKRFYVVSYRNSTSNHNCRCERRYAALLYLIEILHQTTTNLSSPLLFCCCILSKFYIKPQPSAPSDQFSSGCILSKFYIKPQLVRNYYGYSQVVSYRNSTSNHNTNPRTRCE